MYEDFYADDPWTGERRHAKWKATVVAIATRHADAVDIGFDVDGRQVWIAMPCMAWVNWQQKTGHTLTDRLAAQAAGRFLKLGIEKGDDNGRNMYAMSVAEVLEQVEAVMKEAGSTLALPSLPVIA